MCQAGQMPDPSMNPAGANLPPAQAPPMPGIGQSQPPAPQNPANAMSAAQKAKRLGQGFMAGQAGANAFQQPPQGGQQPPIQMMSSGQSGSPSMGPLADSILQKYFQNMGS